jgi:hypothetical protein
VDEDCDGFTDDVCDAGGAAVVVAAHGVQGMEIGDLTGDGQADLVVLEQRRVDGVLTEVVSVLAGPIADGASTDGATAWLTLATPAIEGRPQPPLVGSTLRVVDATGDGALDLVVGVPWDGYDAPADPWDAAAVDAAWSATPGGVFVYAGPLGAGALDAATVRVVGAAGHHLGTSLAAGDLDDDGLVDLAMAGDLDTVWVLPAVAAGEWLVDVDATAISTGDTFDAAVEAVDMDGDGDQDLWVGGPQLAAVWLFRAPLLGDLDTADAWAERTGGVGVGSALAAVDADGDGLLDTVVAQPEVVGGSTVCVVPSPVMPGSTALATADCVIAGAAGNIGVELATGDLDGDLVGEVAVVSLGATADGDRVWLVPGDAFPVGGDIDLAASQVLSGGLYGTVSVAIGDLAGSAAPELVVAGPDLIGIFE